MSWFKSLFSKNKAEEEEFVEESVDKQLAGEITHCNKQKAKAEEDVNQLRKWASEAIREVFEVSHHFWYTELEKYGEIKKQPENKEISNELVKQCDEIVEGYENQIAFRKSKIRLYESLIEKHRENLKRYDAAKEKLQRQEEMHKTTEALDKHRQRLLEMQQKSGKLSESIGLEEQSTQFEWELKRVEDEYEINKSIEKEMAELESSMHEKPMPDLTDSFTLEVNKLVDKINQKQDDKK